MAVAPRHERVDWTLVHKIVYFLTRVFPVRIKALHFLSIPNHKRPFLPLDVVNMVVQVFGRFIFLPHVQTHIQTKPGQILQDLLDLGLHKKEIPLSYGGEWKIDEWYAWCRSQKEEHLEKYGSSFQLNHSVHEREAGVSVARSATNLHASSQESSSPASRQQQEVDERVAKRRMADLLHSRRKRERQRQEVTSLRQSSESLMKENQQLKSHQARLEHCLIQVQEIVRSRVGGDNDG